MKRLRRWRPRHLLLSWCVYWIGLGLFTLRPAIDAALKLSRQSGSHGTAVVSFDNSVLSASITEGGRALWSGSITLLSLALLLAGPPLLLWLVWLFSASRTNNADPLLTNHPRAREIHAAEPRNGIVDTSTSKYPQREEL
jgi:hypothetical protein